MQRVLSQSDKIINMTFITIVAFLLPHFFLSQFSDASAKVPAIIVFGDSSVDSGNNNQIATLLKSNFAPYGRDFEGGKPTGRFSNGRIPPDFISEAFGIKRAVPAYLDPDYNITDFATGVCFASAGTGYDNATSAVLSVIPLHKEIEYYREYQNKLKGYLGNEKANEVIKKAIYLISMGTNDFLENYYFLPRRSNLYSINAYQNYLAENARNLVKDLYELGARKIALGGVPPMGCLPLERTINVFSGRGCVEEYNNVAKEFNKRLETLVMKMNKDLDGIQLVFSNPYSIFEEMIHNPSLYGFRNADTACCGTGYFEMSYMCNRMNLLTCSDANRYVFWDSFHPTERANSILADNVLKNSLAQFL